MAFSLSSARRRPLSFGHAQPRWPLFGSYLRVLAERRALATLEPARLRDLGISQADAAREAARPFWDLPKNRDL